MKRHTEEAEVVTLGRGKRNGQTGNNRENRADNTVAIIARADETDDITSCRFPLAVAGSISDTSKPEGLH